MAPRYRLLKFRSFSLLFLALFLVSLSLTGARGEECKMGSDLDPAIKTALTNTAQQLFQYAAQGNAASLQQNAIPAVAANFGGIQSALQDNKENFGSSANVRGVYALDAPGNAPIARAEFFCGIINSKDYVAFQIENLPPGNYGLVILDAQDGKSPISVSMILQQTGSAWKLAGFYARPTSLAGHDSQWYLQQARSFKAKGENMNAWFYYLAAWELAAPVPFMSNPSLERIGAEAQQAKPANLPGEQPMQLVAGGKTYSLTNMFALPLENGLGLIVKYQVPDISNTQQTYAANTAVINALVQKYPELRNAFDAVVARAVAPGGQDYGTLLAMKDVK